MRINSFGFFLLSFVGASLSLAGTLVKTVQAGEDTPWIPCSEINEAERLINAKGTDYAPEAVAKFYDAKAKAGALRDAQLDLADGFYVFARSLVGPGLKNWDWREAIAYCATRPTATLATYVLEQSGLNIDRLRECHSKTTSQPSSPSVGGNLEKNVEKILEKIPPTRPSGKTNSQGTTKESGGL